MERLAEIIIVMMAINFPFSFINIDAITDLLIDLLPDMYVFFYIFNDDNVNITSIVKVLLLLKEHLEK